MDDLFECANFAPELTAMGWIENLPETYRTWKVKRIAVARGYTYKDSTITQYESLVSSFDFYLRRHGSNILNADTGQIEQHLAALAGRDGKPHRMSIRRNLVTLNELLEYLVMSGMRQSNPCDSLMRRSRYAPVAPEAPPHLTPDKIQSLVSYLSTEEHASIQLARDALAMGLALGCGLQAQEIIALRPADLCLDDPARVNVASSDQRPARSVPLPDWVVLLAHRWGHQRAARNAEMNRPNDPTREEFLFPAERIGGGLRDCVTIDTLQTNFKLLAEKAGIEAAGPARLRNSFALIEVIKGSDNTKIKTLMGLATSFTIDRIRLIASPFVQ